MSYIETYKMHVSDLLNPNGDKLDSQGLKNVTVLKMKDEYSAMKTLFKGKFLPKRFLHILKMTIIIYFQSVVKFRIWLVFAIAIFRLK